MNATKTAGGSTPSREPFFSRHFGIIFTSIISVAIAIATTVVSFAQLSAASQESHRQWGIEAAKFIADNQDVLFGEDDEQRAVMQRIIGAAFPDRYRDAILGAMSEAYGDRLLARFSEAEAVGGGTSTRDELKLWIADSAHPDLEVAELFRPEYRELRTDAVRELDLASRVVTTTVVPQQEVDVARRRVVESGGATATTTTRLPDGRMRVGGFRPAPRPLPRPR